MELEKVQEKQVDLTRWFGQNHKNDHVQLIFFY